MTDEHEDGSEYYHVKLFTHYGAKRFFDIKPERVNNIIEMCEEQWDYLKITDIDNNVIYMTKGFERYENRG